MYAPRNVTKSIFKPAAAGLFVALALAAGCKSKTETGYEPRKLGDSMTIQRGYYASPFSTTAREAQAAQAEGGGPNRKPDVGGNAVGPGRY
jgi:hypothetical protein